MSELTVAAGKFARLIDYIKKIGLDADAIAARINLVPQKILALDADEQLPALQYGRLYQEAVGEMQTLGRPIPWAAGLGSEAFELMCRCLISTRTLGEALRIAERFDQLVYPLLGYSMRLLDDPAEPYARLSYRVKLESNDTVMAPSSWDRSDARATLARASGLIVWGALCGWLTGQPVECRLVRIAAPNIGDAYEARLSRVFHCDIEFDAEENTLSFERAVLERRLVHTAQSLTEFLDASVYHLIAVDSQPASTSAAIKSLVSIDLSHGLPSFTAVAETLHMSESSLRRRLQKENTSYQALKDEIRCEVAIDQLLNRNAKVAEVAEYLGFTEPSSFVRSFKSWTGQTPNGYRERMQALG